MTRDAIQRMKRIDHLIRIKGTGNASELGYKLGLSRAHTYQYLNLMKALGAPIKYCKYRQSYYYDEEGSFITGFLPKNVVEGAAKSFASIVSFTLVIEIFRQHL